MCMLFILNNNFSLFEEIKAKKAYIPSFPSVFNIEQINGKLMTILYMKTESFG